MAISDRIELDIDVPFYLPNIGIYKIALHLIQAFFSLLVASLIGSVISFENHHLESSQPNSKFTLVSAICSLLVALILAIAPISKFRMIKPFRNLFLRPRTDLVLNILFSLAWIIVSIVVTTQALEQCTRELINESMTLCNCIKTSAAFSWLAVFTWIGTVIHSLILFCNQKQVNRNSVYEKEDIPSSSSSSSSYDADAPTIVEMQYSEKHKQPIVSYNAFHGSIYEPPQQAISSDTTPPMYIPESPYLHSSAEHVYIQPYESDPYNPYIASSVPFPHKY
ncbi:hypothetical protein K501DRAFT_337072 [Backusella circina FSU 941]|nr:hypothetical protein K501DRAFT_337072 [Backusella circina FSU 941]